MRKSQILMTEREETPVDDVRRIRESLDREAGGDVVRLLEQSHEFFEKHWKSLGLKRSSSQIRQTRRKARVAGPREETPVDDVRRVRERLSREAGGDVRRRAGQSAESAEKYVKLLGLKRISLDEAPQPRSKHRTPAKRRASRV